MTIVADLHKDRFEKLKGFRCLKVAAFWPQINKAHGELRLRYQPVNQAPSSAFRHSWIPPQDAWTSELSAVYCRLFEGYTALSFWRYVIARSFYRQLSLSLGCAQLQTDQMYVGDPVQCQIVRTKQTVGPAVSNGDTIVVSAVSVCPIRTEYTIVRFKYLAASFFKALGIHFSRETKERDSALVNAFSFVSLLVNGNDHPSLQIFGSLECHVVLYYWTLLRDVYCSFGSSRYALFLDSSAWS